MDDYGASNLEKSITGAVPLAVLEKLTSKSVLSLKNPQFLK